MLLENEEPDVLSFVLKHINEMESSPAMKSVIKEVEKMFSCEVKFDQMG